MRNNLPTRQGKLPLDVWDNLPYDKIRTHLIATITFQQPLEFVKDTYGGELFCL